MGIGGRINDDELYLVAGGLLNTVDDFALAIRLEGLQALPILAEAPETVAADASGGAGRSPQAIELAEREGFEPSVEGLPLHVISSHADSTTRASLRRGAGGR